MKFTHFFLILSLILIVIAGSLLISERHQKTSLEADNEKYNNSQSESTPLEINGGNENASRVEPECLHPAYGELNIHSIRLSENEVMIHKGDKVVVRGNITGKEYHVGESGGSKNTCYYDGCVVLKAYLGPEASKSSWSYMQGKLTKVEGLDTKITPQKFCLKPNETIEFQVEVIAQKAGTYYLYIVAFGEKGWKSWDVIEVEVR
ncbi:hypothetical protein PAP_07300 [Palaeococcus pacificus DY20341]|uniref:Uncharacterized protein n=1 Tax=Palaeococcus pacificus DY20341 TaxID=1343739 RepID=A0A075LSX2_9EURY|nr:hypothetical protein [Palaeococcus pacificus]AIF69850.1 hypothetical protein PAP_07300 [Palaeococcus pacificus DY20341]